MEDNKSTDKRFCACGCGELTTFYRGKPNEFKKGHRIRGSNHPMWKGGKHINDGYVYIFKPEHPHADARHYVKEHRLVMEQHLGRLLNRVEQVHHINGIRDDNRIENLQLVTRSEHNRIHKIKDMSDRKCLECNSDDTYVRENGHGQWLRHLIPKRGWLCEKCHHKMQRHMTAFILSLQSS